MKLDYETPRPEAESWWKTLLFALGGTVATFIGFIGAMIAVWYLFQIFIG